MGASSRSRVLAFLFVALFAASCGGGISAESSDGGGGGSGSGGREGGATGSSSSGSSGSSSGSGPAGSVDASVPTGSSDASVPPGQPPEASVPPVCIDAGFSGPYSDGSGYNGIIPSACSAAIGTRHAFASVSDVVTLLSQVWFDCSGQPVLRLLGNGRAIAFTSGGQFTALNEGDDGTLVLVADTADGTGTYVVTDTSATNGPNTYSLQLTTTFGAVYDAQIIADDAPSTLSLVLTSEAPDTFAPALPMKPRAGICGPAFGPPAALATVADITAALTGRWVWCADGNPPAAGPFQQPFGIQFNADGTYVDLDEDDQGNLVAGMPGSFTVTVGGASSFTMNMTANDTVTTPGAISECPRSLAFGDPSNLNSVLLPLP